MDLKQLEYFVRVAELGSFTRAAQVLDMAQPSLSRQIRLLEVELRQTLLLRNGRGAQPTEAGQVLLEHGRGILHQVSRAREELARVQGGLAGRVALGLPPSVARLMAVPLTHVLRQRLPQAAVAMTEGLSASMQEWLLSGRLDVALLYNAPLVSGLDIQPLLEETLYVVEVRPPGLSSSEEPPPKPMPLAELATQPLIIPTRPNAIRMQVEAEMAQAGLKPHIGLEIDGIPAILDLVLDGAGVAVLPQYAVMHSLRPSAYRLRALQPAMSTRLSIATSAQRPVTLTQKAVIGLMVESIQALHR